MFLSSLCIRIQRNNTARIQYLKKKRRKTSKKEEFMCAQNKRNQTVWHIEKKKNFQNLFFSFRQNLRIKINENTSVSKSFFTNIYI
jgi:hypothetical protein